MPKTTPTLICGKTPEQIRRAFFEGQLDQLLNDIQANQEVTDEDVMLLEAELDRLQTEKDSARKKLSAKYNVASHEEIKPPTVEELVGDVDEEAVKAWVTRKDKDIKRLREIISIVSTQAKKNGLSREAMENFLLEISGLRSSVDQDRVHKDQLYHQRITEIIDRHQMSRREAEDRAKITKEYRDYKLATLFADNFEGFEIALRKKISNNY